MQAAHYRSPAPERKRPQGKVHVFAAQPQPFSLGYDVGGSAGQPLTSGRCLQLMNVSPLLIDSSWPDIVNPFFTKEWPIASVQW